MAEKIDLNKLYHESKKERTEKQTKMERALEGVVCGFPRNTADDPILKNKMAQKNMNQKREVIINDIGRNIVYLRNLSDGK